MVYTGLFLENSDFLGDVLRLTLEMLDLVILFFLRKPDGELSLEILVYFCYFFLFDLLVTLSYSLAVQKGLESSFETPLC